MQFFLKVTGYWKGARTVKLGGGETRLKIFPFVDCGWV